MTPFAAIRLFIVERRRLEDDEFKKTLRQGAREEFGERSRSRAIGLSRHVDEVDATA